MQGTQPSYICFREGVGRNGPPSSCVTVRRQSMVDGERRGPAIGRRRTYVGGARRDHTVLRRRELGAVAVVLLILTAGCGTTAELTDEPVRNATLSVSGYEQTADASPVETRAFWDRRSNWEDPDVRNLTVTSRTRTYHNLSGADTVVVYTTPKRPYVEADRPRSMSPVELAALATQAVETSLVGNDSQPGHTASLLDRNVTVHALTDTDGATTGHVASVATSDAVVVVVVVGDTDGRTVDRVLGGVTLSGGFETDE